MGDRLKEGDDRAVACAGGGQFQDAVAGFAQAAGAAVGVVEVEDVVVIREVGHMMRMSVTPELRPAAPPGPSRLVSVKRGQKASRPLSAMTKRSEVVLVPAL